MISGSLVALATPLHKISLDIDWGALKALVDWHVDQGTDGIVAVGTTGESATLNVAEHESVIRCVVETAAGRIPVIAGTGANCTREALTLTKAAQKAGVDACLLVTPYYNKPTQEGLYRHYKTIAESADVLQILYNVPGRTACDMQLETVLRLAEHENIVGIKDATGDLDRGRQIIEQSADQFAIYSGDDATARELMLLGGHGNISVTANVAPARMAAMCAAALRGDAEQAKLEDAVLRSLHKALFVESNPIPVKWALAQMGFIEDGLRLPLTSLAEDSRMTVIEALQDAKIQVKTKF
ncbi:MAG: 4-hydroxy-tetrahydrodipicolinate synthase [Porticoccaceae bacterium]|nr:4-hydroxy-tetrahydrodipicolinate synthase [Porticoccaceae bacterium]